ncbi:MAG: MAPEG family protein [Deltaproteobacteria bacterium]|nr:MAPEG family protein [Deltaproteobacteria bacterium]
MDLFRAYPALATLGLVTCVLVLKMLAVGLATTYHRMRLKRFATAEDLALVPGASTERHDDIERARRAHRNDLENIPPFLWVAFFFALTRPPAAAAAIYFWGFTGARIAHSVFYLASVQPFRTLSYTVGWLALVAMTIHTWIRL